MGALWNFSPSITAKITARNKLLQPNCWGGTKFSVFLDEYLPLYLSEKDLKDPKKIRNLTEDMLLCNFYYGINPEEYLIHSFSNKSKEQREKYFSKKQKDQAIFRKAGKDGDKAFIELKDKFQFYQKAKKYFHRDACAIYGIDDREVFIAFCKQHHKFFAKPIQGRYGKGNRVVNLSDVQQTANELFDELLNYGTWMIEELIDQDERMKVWNETSVNTIRIPSFKTARGIEIFYPFIRMGRKGSIVDNAGSGGIMTVVDAKTGRICTRAKDELGNVYERNPDNGKVFIDWQVPEWESLLTLNREVHNSLPDYHKYIGFDYALSQKYGWVLVEGNWGDFICQQACLERGLKNEILNLLNG